MKATVSFHQRGYAGGKTTLMVKDGDKPLASKDVTLGADGADPDGDDVFQRGDGGGEADAVFADADWRVRRTSRTMR